MNNVILGNFPQHRRTDLNLGKVSPVDFVKRRFSGDTDINEILEIIWPYTKYGKWDRSGGTKPTPINNPTNTTK